MRHALKLLLPLAAACGGPAVPAAVTCDGDVHAASDDATLSAALAAAVRGDCVVLAAGSYAGPITVATAGLTITAEEGAAPEITSASDGLRLDGQEVRAHGLTVRGAGRHGVVIRGAGSSLTGSSIRASGEAGLMIKCEDSGCMQGGTGLIGAEDVEISGGSYGVFVSGSDASLIRTVITDSASDMLGGGTGVYAVAGAALTLESARIAGNTYGLIADGASTRVLAVDTVVEGNADLGIWGQGLRGSASLPALELRGAGGRVVGNGVTGVGLFDSTGALVQGGEISGTLEKEVLIDLARRVRIGDGLAVLASSGEVQVASTRIADNARAQAVVDAAGAGVRFEASNAVSGGQHRVVVQNSAQAVVVPAGDQTTPPAALPTRIQGLAVPPLAP